MNWGFIGLLVVFAAFIILLIVNPNLSCFGRRLKSPFYPLIHRSAERKSKAHHRTDGQELPAGGKARDKETEDYGFKLD